MTYYVPGQRYHCKECEVEQISVAPYPPCWVCGQPTERGETPGVPPLSAAAA